jgi:hypothetical protein
MFLRRNKLMSMMCGECLDKRVELVPLVNGICPKCKTDYAATADVFNIPVKARPGQKRK